MAAELILFMRETVSELGERRAVGFLKKFYGWYLGAVASLVRSSRSSSGSTRQTTWSIGCSSPNRPRATRSSGSRPSCQTLEVHARAAADLGVRRRLAAVQLPDEPEALAA